MVYVVILNWNGIQDTLQCLDSVIRLRCPDFRIVVCDNASEDGSWSRLQAWAGSEATQNGESTFPTQDPNLEFSLGTLSVRAIGGQEAQNGHIRADSRVTLIQNGANLGFAGGCNVGLRFALAQPDLKYAWILNNDTHVTPDSLDELVNAAASDFRAGIIGSTLLDMDPPHRVQALGQVSYSTWRARGFPVGAGLSLEDARQQAPTPGGLTYVQGASMLVSREFLEKVGLMNEEFFLYFEEVDWAIRGLRKGFRTGYARESIVYHRGGASIGSGNAIKPPSLIAEYFSNRNRLIFTKKYFPVLSLWVRGLLIAGGIRRILSGRHVVAMTIISLAFGRGNRQFEELVNKIGNK